MQWAMYLLRLRFDPLVIAVVFTFLSYLPDVDLRIKVGRESPMVITTITIHYVKIV